MTDDREPRRIPIVDKRVMSASEEASDEEASAEAADDVEEAEVVSEPDPVAEATQLAEDRLDQLKRLKADFENYRQRVIREQTELVERASLRIVERLIPVMDDLERALGADRDADDPLMKGVELVFKQLHDVLADEGLERIDHTSGFDPQDHEAVSSVPADVDEPTILEVVRSGYKLKGKTVRPALVHVCVPEQQETGEER